MLVTQPGQDSGQIEQASMQGAAQDDGAPDAARHGLNLVAGGLHRLEDPLGAGLQRCAVLGDGDRRDGPVEQGHPKLVFQPGDGAGHRRLDDVGLVSGRGETAGRTAGQEVIQIADLHWLRLGPGRAHHQ